MALYTEEGSISKHADHNLPVDFVLDGSFGAPHWFAVDVINTGTFWFYQYPGCLIGMDGLNSSGLSTHWKPKRSQQPTFLNVAPIFQLDVPFPTESWCDEEVRAKLHIALLLRITKNEYEEGSSQQGEWLGPYGGDNIKKLLNRPYRSKEGINACYYSYSKL